MVNWLTKKDKLDVVVLCLEGKLSSGINGKMLKIQLRVGQQSKNNFYAFCM